MDNILSLAKVRKNFLLTKFSANNLLNIECHSIKITIFIYHDKELSEDGTRKKFFLVRQEGNRQVQREIDHYNLDMIIALGYRVRLLESDFDKAV